MCELSINFHAYKIHSKSSIDKFCSYIHICIKISLVHIIFLSLSVSHLADRRCIRFPFENRNLHMMHLPLLYLAQLSMAYYNGEIPTNSGRT